MNEGQRLGQFYLTGDHNQMTETHQGEGRMRRPRTGPGRTDKSDKISVSKSKSDRQAAYLYQTRSHCRGDTKKLRQAGLTCALCHSLSKARRD